MAGCVREGTAGAKHRFTHLVGRAVKEESHPASAEGLAEFIRDTPGPICFQAEREARFTPAFKSQTLGEGLRTHLLEKLNRYETHLDREFERTLAMLLKLKELRGV